MAEITAITPQKKDHTRCNVEVDGRFFCGMNLETVVKNRLKAGVIVTTEELNQMQLESEKATALDKALTHISSTMKTEKQIRDFLTKKGYLQDVCDYVIEKMREYAYIDDEAYARAYLESAGKKKGKKLVEMQLKQKGVSEEAIGAALSSYQEDGESAAKLLEKYVRNKPQDKNTMRKAAGYLYSKGFSSETIQTALKRVFGGDDTLDED